MMVSNLHSNVTQISINLVYYVVNERTTNIMDILYLICIIKSQFLLPNLIALIFCSCLGGHKKSEMVTINGQINTSVILKT